MSEPNNFYRGSIACERCGTVYMIPKDAQPFRHWLCYTIVDRLTGARCWTMWKSKAPR